jgi:small conductance mechanosensitive channel
MDWKNRVANDRQRRLSKLIAAVSLIVLITANAAIAAASSSQGAALPKTAVDWKDRIANYVETHGPAILSAILILVVGVFVARWVGRLAMTWLTRKEMQLEPPVRMLIVRLLRLLVLVMALVIAAGTAGMDVTAMVASIGVAGVGVGLATQGVLSNVVAGLTIIFTKPFRVGEYIEMLGTHGQVTAIELFSTTLLHSDRSRVIIPNRKIVGEILHNYGTMRQLDVSVGVGYGTNIPEALATIREILTRNPRVLKDPAPALGVTALGDSAVNIAVKPWVSVNDFGAAGGEIIQAILEQFRTKSIEIPFPQREIRLLNGGAEDALATAQSSSSARPQALLSSQ